MKKVWQCENCGKTYDTIAEAEQCEVSHKHMILLRHNAEVIVRVAGRVFVYTGYIANITKYLNHIEYRVVGSNGRIAEFLTTDEIRRHD